MTTDFLTSVVVNVLTTTGLFVVAREFLLHWLRGCVTHEFNEKLESFKHELKSQHEIALAQLQRDYAIAQGVQDTATKSLAEVHRVAHEKRLDAIQKVWMALSDLRQRTPDSVVLYGDVFPPSQYKRFFETPALAPDLHPGNERKLYKECHDIFSVAEYSRPFLTDSLYATFCVYREVHFRLYNLLIYGKESGQIKDWRPAIKGLLSTVLTDKQVAQIQDSNLSSIRIMLEFRFLKEAARIISGEAAADFTFEKAQQLADQISKREPELAPNVGHVGG